MNHAAFIRTIAAAVLCATLGSASFAAPNPASTDSDDSICTRTQCQIEEQPISQHLPDDQPVLVAPNCTTCGLRGTQSPAQSLPEPILVAPRGCGTSCTSPMAASERLQRGEPGQPQSLPEPILVAPNCSTCRLGNPRA